jgi:hypothetical protein
MLAGKLLLRDIEFPSICTVVWGGNNKARQYFRSTQYDLVRSDKLGGHALSLTE